MGKLSLNFMLLTVMLVSNLHAQDLAGVVSQNDRLASIVISSEIVA